VRRIGPHLPLGDGLVKAADRALEIEATAIQIFTDNPTAWRRRGEPPAELAEFRRRLGAADIGPLSIHAPYLINLCGSDVEFWQKSVATMVNELRVGALYGARFVVMHIGSHRGHGRKHGLRRLAEGIAAVFDESADLAGAPLLVLENAVGSGDGVGSRLEDLADAVELAATARVDLDRLGLCLDTAHLWAQATRCAARLTWPPSSSRSIRSSGGSASSCST
jgi:deoxyribonuclease IV